MTSPETRNLTIDAEAAQRASREAQAQVTLVFRWNGGRELVDMDRARALTVGRGSACDVRIEDQSLSRQHARFTRDAEGVRVEDLDSRNGVLLEGKRVKGSVLQSGDVLMLGHVAVSVHAFGVPSAVPAPAADGGSELNWAGAGMLEVRKQIEKIAPTPLPVLVLGETGCGKELIAREVHRLSPRAKAPLRVVNCAAIPANLIESTLFGHERGAFTGADRAQPGMFEQASHGTIFLDEIGELSAAAQAALLRVLETGSFNRVGATREQEADVRVVAATHRDLHAMTLTGAFRLDLLHRLDAVSVKLPPLRERRDAIDPLIEQFLLRAQRTLGSRKKTLADSTREVLHAYDWPGNVRELRNVIERAVAISDSDVIGVADLPDRVRSPGTAPAASLQPSAAKAHAPSPQAAYPTLPAPPLAPEGHGGMSVREQRVHDERELLLRTLEAARGDQTEAAARLGWSLRTLQRRVQQYGFGRPRK